MGLTVAKVKIENIFDGRKSKELDFLVDTGAFLSIVPKEILKEIGVKPEQRKVFTLANGKKIMRRIGQVIFHYKKYYGPSWVIFGEREDKTLLGVLAIESMGLEVDPIKKRLKPTELLLL
jgi:clan AA aspartic protease